MNDEEIIKLQKRARHVARSKGYPDRADDFAQEACLAVIRWPGQRLDHAFIDYLRKDIGRAGLPSYELRATQRARTFSLDAPVGGEAGDSMLHHELIGCPDRDTGFERYFIRLREMLREEERVIFTLRVKWGFLEKEIADCFGVTESRISQRLKELQACLSRHVAREEQREGQVMVKRVSEREEEERPCIPRQGKREVETVQPKEKRIPARLEYAPTFCVAEIKPRQMALDHEASFNPWLT